MKKNIVFMEQAINLLQKTVSEKSTEIENLHTELAKVQRERDEAHAELAAMHYSYTSMSVVTFMGKPFSYWLELEANAKKSDYAELFLQLTQTRAELAQARQELDALRERERWIPCAERLPEVGETYYVLRKCPDAWDYQIATYKRGAVDGTYFWFSEILAVNLSYVTHYHPLLPEPPSLP